MSDEGLSGVSVVFGFAEEGRYDTLNRLGRYHDKPCMHACMFSPVLSKAIQSGVIKSHMHSTRMQVGR